MANLGHILSPIQRDSRAERVLLPGKSYQNYSYPDILIYKNAKKIDSRHFYFIEKNEFEISLRQFVDFVNLIVKGRVYNGLGKRLDEFQIDNILNDIFHPEYREFFSTQFKRDPLDPKTVYGIYDSYSSPLVFEDSPLIFKCEKTSRRKKVEPCQIYEEKNKELVKGFDTYEIDLGGWFVNADELGLPKQDKDFNIYNSRFQGKTISYLDIIHHRNSLARSRHGFSRSDFVFSKRAYVDFVDFCGTFGAELGCDWPVEPYQVRTAILRDSLEKQNGN